MALAIKPKGIISTLIYSDETWKKSGSLIHTIKLFAYNWDTEEDMPPPDFGYPKKSTSPLPP